MVNPDNFILHSDFWYPTNYISGSQVFSNVSIPATFTLSSQYHDGDYYSVFIDYTTSTQIASQFNGDTAYVRTQGNNLKLFKGAQSVGSTFSATVYWRIYPKNAKLNFLSANNLETTDKTIKGTYTGNFINLNLASGMPTGNKYLIRGTWRLDGGPWQIIDSVFGYGNGIFAAYYDYSANAVKGRVFTTDGNNHTFDYNIQLVPATLPSKFIFNSNKYSFAFPQNFQATITDPGNISASATKTLYGDWVTIGNATMPYDAIYKWTGNTDHDTQQGYDEFPFSGTATSPNVTAIPSVQTNGNQVRPVLTVRNNTSSAVTYSAQSVKYYIYLYQNNNAG